MLHSSPWTRREIYKYINTSLKESNTRETKVIYFRLRQNFNINYKVYLVSNSNFLFSLSLKSWIKKFDTSGRDFFVKPYGELTQWYQLFLAEGVVFKIDQILHTSFSSNQIHLSPNLTFQNLLIRTVFDINRGKVSTLSISGSRKSMSSKW